jgi:hypothetical protein
LSVPVASFISKLSVNAGVYEKTSIQVMVINAGMINSETMSKSFDKGIFDKHTVPKMVLV